MKTITLNTLTQHQILSNITYCSSTITCILWWLNQNAAAIAAIATILTFTINYGLRLVKKIIKLCRYFRDRWSNRKGL